MMRKLFPFLLVLLVHSVEAQTVDALRREVARDGASAVAGRLSDRPDWPQILRKIERGRREWVELAITLHRGSDGHTSEEITSALGAALVFAPARVLLIAAPEFDVQSLCSGPDVDDPRFDSLESSKAEIARRTASVDTLPKTKVVRECLAALQASEAHISRFFGE